jgi:hypothetical protein
LVTVKWTWMWFSSFVEENKTNGTTDANTAPWTLCFQSHRSARSWNNNQWRRKWRMELDRGILAHSGIVSGN